MPRRSVDGRPGSQNRPAAAAAVPLTIVLSFIFVEGSIRFRAPADPLGDAGGGRARRGCC
jgi:hypothetical protein